MSAVSTRHPVAAITSPVPTAATAGTSPVRTSEPAPNAWITATGQIAIAEAHVWLELASEGARVGDLDEQRDHRGTFSRSARRRKTERAPDRVRPLRGATLRGVNRIGLAFDL